MKKYIAFSEQGTKTIHYFETYQDAKNFIVQNKHYHMKIAEIKAFYKEQNLTELKAGGESYDR